MSKKLLSCMLFSLLSANAVIGAQEIDTREDDSFCGTLRSSFCYSAFYPISGANDSEIKSIDKALGKVKDYGDFGRLFSRWISKHSHPMTASSSIASLATLPTNGRLPYVQFISDLFAQSRKHLRVESNSKPFTLLSFDRAITNTAGTPSDDYYSFSRFYGAILDNMERDHSAPGVGQIIGTAGLSESDGLSWMMAHLAKVPAERHATVLLLSKRIIPANMAAFARGEILSALRHAKDGDTNLVSYVAPYVDSNLSSLSGSVIEVFAKLTNDQRQELVTCVDELAADANYITARGKSRTRYNWSTDEENKVFRAWAFRSLAARPSHIIATMNHFKDNVVLYNDMYKEATQ